jgi:hypothetical protein
MSVARVGLIDRVEFDHKERSWVKGLQTLRILNLRGTRITDTGLEELRGLTNLQSLNVSRTAVTDGGYAELRKALPELAD